nr:immunoglobulin heavy chain junction region [Mus musculus]
CARSYLDYAMDYW